MPTLPITKKYPNFFLNVNLNSFVLNSGYRRCHELALALFGAERANSLESEETENKIPTMTGDSIRSTPIHLYGMTRGSLPS